jgi:hypothetical protein
MNAQLPIAIHVLQSGRYCNLANPLYALHMVTNFLDMSMDPPSVFQAQFLSNQGIGDSLVIAYNKKGPFSSCPSFSKIMPILVATLMEALLS